MPRFARVVLPGVPLHITQRGVRRFDVFRDESDFRDYLDLFKESCGRFGLRICAYCLMTNHVHFVAIPEREDSLWRTFQGCHGRYASAFNKKYQCSGHVWQARPYSCALDESHLWAAIRYVERNPVRAGMVSRAEQYHWSSAAAHCGLVEDPLLDSIWRLRDEIPDWKEWLAIENAGEVDNRIRRRTHTGRPCGDDAFVRAAESLTGRCLAPQKPGPKAKQGMSECQRLLWSPEEM